MTNAGTDRVMEEKAKRQEMLDSMDIEDSTAYTFSPPDDRDEYIQKLETQVAKVKKVMDKLAAKSETLESAAREDFEQHRQILQKRYDTMRSRLADIRNSGDAAWKDLRGGAQNAWSELADAAKRAAEKFK